MSHTNATHSRLPLPDRADMTAEQVAVFDQAMAFFGAPIGPRIALIDTPEVALAWSRLLIALEASALPKRLWELAILIVARDWSSQFEWWAHEGKAVSAGISRQAIDAIRDGKRPQFAEADEAATYAYVRELLQKRSVSDDVHARLRKLIGTRQLVELTVLVGHYSNVAMTLVAHAVPLPAGVTPPLPRT
ncbi:carboxymuconolactone decarboxylase family protein [Novosphingobium sp. BL-52-GroH]|uniref:carboxymuconolactone decarboxylase family protein n=1 Tax=Novosphingobium sp. BL-52-GroH TaxID=3349877 RepID=UPI0038504FA8